jgi:hypothetical protein
LGLKSLAHIVILTGVLQFKRPQMKPLEDSFRSPHRIIVRLAFPPFCASSKQESVSPSV